MWRRAPSTTCRLSGPVRRREMVYRPNEYCSVVAANGTMCGVRAIAARTVTCKVEAACVVRRRPGAASRHPARRLLLRQRGTSERESVGIQTGRQSLPTAFLSVERDLAIGVHCKLGDSIILQRCQSEHLTHCGQPPAVFASFSHHPADSLPSFAICVINSTAISIGCQFRISDFAERSTSCASVCGCAVVVAGS